MQRSHSLISKLKPSWRKVKQNVDPACGTKSNAFGKFQYFSMCITDECTWRNLKYCPNWPFHFIWWTNLCGRRMCKCIVKFLFIQLFNVVMNVFHLFLFAIFKKKTKWKKQENSLNALNIGASFRSHSTSLRIVQKNELSFSLGHS